VPLVDHIDGRVLRTKKQFTDCSSHSLCEISALVETWFELLPNCFCDQEVCHHNSAISPTESTSTFFYTTPRIDHNCYFLHTVNSYWACSKSSRHAQSYISMALWHIHLPTVRLNSLVHWTTVSALLGSPLLRWHIAGQAWWFRRCISQRECFLFMRRCRRANTLPLAIL